MRSLVANQYVDTLGDNVVFEKSARGLVRELNDPYSELLSPKGSEDFNRNVNGRYGGTGSNIMPPPPRARRWRAPSRWRFDCR